MSSTDAKRLKFAVFYLDESIFSHVLLTAMKDAGANVRHAGDAVPLGSVDEDWLALVGQNQWIALMRDQMIRRRPLELAVLKSAGVMAFAFTGGQPLPKTRPRRSARAL